MNGGFYPRKHRGRELDKFALPGNYRRGFTKNKGPGANRSLCGMKPLAPGRHCSRAFPIKLSAGAHFPSRFFRLGYEAAIYLPQGGRIRQAASCPSARSQTCLKITSQSVFSPLEFPFPDPRSTQCFSAASCPRLTSFSNLAAGIGVEQPRSKALTASSTVRCGHDSLWPEGICR